MINKTTALIYIGQTPRNDITPEMKGYLDGSCNIIETGVLDGLSFDEISRMYPRHKDHVLITKLNNGAMVTVDGEIICRLIAEKIASLKEQGCDSCAIMCTGSFHDLPDEFPVITSDNAFHRNMVFSETIHTIGLIVPVEDQMKPFAALYEKKGRVVAEHASPYGESREIVEAALRLKAKGADCICLDCMGYSGSIADAVSNETGLKCFIPRKEIAKQIKRLYE